MRNLVENKNGVMVPFVECEHSVSLSKNVEIPIDKMTTRLNNNTFVFSKTFRDRNKNYIIPNILKCNTNYVIVDSDKTIYEKTRRTLIKNGYDVKIFDLSNPSDCKSYNFFDYMDLSGSVINLANIIIDFCSENSDVFERESLVTLLSSLILYTKNYSIKSSQNFLNVLDLLSNTHLHNDRLEPIDTLMEDTIIKHGPNEAFNLYAKFKTMAGNNVINYFKLLADKLNLTDFEKIAEKISYDELELVNFNRSKQALFIINSTDKYVKTLNSILISQLLLVVDATFRCNIQSIHFMLPYNFVNTYHKPEIIKHIIIGEKNKIFFSVFYLDGCDLGNGNCCDKETLFMYFDRLLYFGSEKSQEFFYLLSKNMKTTIELETIRKLKNNECIILLNQFNFILDKKINA